jgi:hypothetical protein
VNAQEGGKTPHKAHNYQNVKTIKMSKFAREKLDFLTPNCPALAKNAVIWGFRKTQMRFSNG